MRGYEEALIDAKIFLMTIDRRLFSEAALMWILTLDPEELLILRDRVEGMGGQERFAREWKIERALVQEARDF